MVLQIPKKSAREMDSVLMNMSEASKSLERFVDKYLFVKHRNTILLKELEEIKDTCETERDDLDEKYKEKMPMFENLPMVRGIIESFYGAAHSAYDMREDERRVIDEVMSGIREVVDVFLDGALDACNTQLQIASAKNAELDSKAKELEAENALLKHRLSSLEPLMKAEVAMDMVDSALGGAPVEGIGGIKNSLPVAMTQRRIKTKSEAR